MKRLLYLMVPISFILSFSSCNKDGFSEEDILKLEQQSGLSVKVYELDLTNGTAKRLIDGASVTIVGGDQGTTSFTTTASGQVRFSNVGKGTFIVEVKKSGYITETKTIEVESSDRTIDTSVEIALRSEKANLQSSIVIRGNVRIQTDLTSAITEVPVDAIVRVYDYYDYNNYSGNTAPLSTAKIDAEGNYYLNVPMVNTSRYLYLIFPTLQLDQKLYVLKDGNPTLVTAKTVFDPYVGATSVPVVGTNISAASPDGFTWPTGWGSLTSYSYVNKGSVLTINVNYGTGSSRVIP